MAVEDFIQEFRRMVDERTDATYSDDVLIADYLEPTAVDGMPDLEAAAAKLWQEKAASYAELVTVSEAGSSRALSDLAKNARDMAKMYRDIVSSRVPVTAPGSRRSQTRAIERA